MSVGVCILKQVPIYPMLCCQFEPQNEKNVNICKRLQAISHSQKGIDESCYFSLSFHQLTLWPNSSETLGQGQPPPSTASVDVAGRGLKINDHFFGTKSVCYKQKNQFSGTLDLSILKNTRRETILECVIQPQEEKGVSRVLRKFPYKIVFPGVLGK